MGTAFLYGNGGSGGTVAALTVTAPAGATVTVSKDGKSKTKVADSTGVAVFKGLSSGQWTLRVTLGELSDQRTVTITSEYSTTISFLEALRSAMATTSYARLSTSVGDKQSIGDRYIIRTTDEPVIFIPSRDGDYFGYGVITLDGEWAAYDKSNYGNLYLIGAGVTEAGNRYYMYSMASMMLSGSVTMQLNGIGDVSVSTTDCYIDTATKSLNGNSKYIEQMHGFIDYLAQIRR